MTNFTIEELKALVAALEFSKKYGWKPIDYEYDISYPILYNKVITMINNYREHELENHCCGFAPENMVCNKCKCYLGGQN